MSLMVYEAQKPYEEEVHPHLNRMNPGLGASYAFHCSDGSTIQRTDGNQLSPSGHQIPQGSNETQWPANLQGPFEI